MVVNVFLFDDFEVMDAFRPGADLWMCTGAFLYTVYFTAWGTDYRKTGNKSMNRAIKSY